jgi:uncharacterized delta-60 repeat protein
MPSRRLSFALLILSVWAVGLLAAGPAFARGHLDPTFGKNGLLVVKSELPEGKEMGQVAPTVGGPIYFTEDTFVCREGGTAPCRNKEQLRRFLPDGGLDPTYGPGSDVFPGLEVEVDLIADANGLPVFGWTRGHQVQLRRLLPSGELDPSFGDGGTVTLGCRCQLGDLEATPDGGLLVSATVSRSPGKGKGPRQVGVSFERLRADGSPDPGFARDGVARVRNKNWYYARAITGPKGRVYVTGQLSGRHGGPGFFATRLNRRGALDKGFGKAVSTALRKAYGGVYSVLWEGLGVFPRPRGVELLASNEGRTSILRTRADGQLDRSFGHGGEARLRLGYSEAADAGGGRLLVEGSRGGGGWYVQMLDSDGRRNHRFGTVYLPGAYGEYGVYIYPDGPGQAIVVSPGETVCRGSCPSDPRLFRVLD